MKILLVYMGIRPPFFGWQTPGAPDNGSATGEPALYIIGLSVLKFSKRSHGTASALLSGT
jgi:hypothetical protein